MPESQQYNYDTLAAGTDSFQEFFFFSSNKMFERSRINIKYIDVNIYQ